MSALLGLFALFTLLTANAPPARSAPPPDLDQVLAAHCRAREATQTMRVRFVQTKIFQALGEEDESSGILYYRKPDALRWEYLQPDTSWTVLRGPSGWSVFPGIRQVQKFSLRSARAEALLSIVGFGSCGRDLREAFQIRLGGAAAGSWVLEMTPTDPQVAASFERIDLTLDAQDYLPRAVEMREVSGDTVRFVFSGMERGRPLEERLFEYEAPKGYEIVE